MDGFRYVSIAPTLLAPGSYVIGGFYSAGTPDELITKATSVTTAPELTYDGGRIGANNSFPTNVGGGNGFFGPNFQFTSPTNGVPEGGSSILLLGMGIGALIIGPRAIGRRTAGEGLRAKGKAVRAG